MLHEGIWAQFSVYGDWLFLQIVTTFYGKHYKSDVMQTAYLI